ncbi:MAG: response regulator [Candidatus Competibacteraceae bacterium]|nr:response regulator [Candidatus Competibacteraceae bacterium]MCP5451298.1 response regulator [Gammaproteobacteria bacterium]
MSLDVDPDDLLDQAYLQRFKSKPARCRDLIQAFLDSTPSILHQLRQALQRHDQEEFRQMLHALYGATETVGARAMKGICLPLSRNPDFAQQQAGIDALESQFQETRTAFLEFLRTLPIEAESSFPATTTQRRVLLVEDNPPARELLHFALGDDYQLLDADHGHAALALCAEDSPPDVAIVDLNLGYAPSQDVAFSGLEVLRRLRGTLPMIVLTVDRSRHSIQAAAQAGAWAYLVKPPDPDTLRATLEAVLARAAEADYRATQRTIDRAIGILMGTLHLSDEEARRLIKHYAAVRRRKAVEVAEQIIQAQEFQNRLVQAARQLRMLDLSET